MWQKFSQWDVEVQVFLGIILSFFSFRENYAHPIVGSMSLICSSMTSSHTLSLETPLTLLPLLTAPCLDKVLCISEFPCPISNSTLYILSSLISQGSLFYPSAWRSHLFICSDLPLFILRNFSWNITSVKKPISSSGIQFSPLVNLMAPQFLSFHP